MRKHQPAGGPAAYEVRGMVASITSYDDPDPGEGNVLNQVVFERDDLGRLVKDFQEHEGAKDANTLYVEYEYAPAATALRLASVKYPNGRRTRYDYGTTAGGALNRLDAIKDDDASTLAAYTWLGLGRMVVEDFVEPNVKLDYFGGASGTYAGVDRFGRVVDQQWYDYAASTVRDRYAYGYDRTGNRLWRENATASAKDEFYTYDGIHRLVNFDRGTLNATKTAVSGTPTREQDWTLDPLGNWTGFVEATSGTTDLSQSRAHNPVNEITDITETQGTAWLTPVHDRAGNMTTVPKPSNLANGLSCTYDAWNRLVEVEDASASVVVARYEYDGRNRRIKKHADSQSPDNPDGIDTYEHFYYAGIQCVETRDTTTENNQPESLQPVYQYVWSARYIDAPVLRDKNTDTDALCDDERLYYLTDANYNVTTLVDTAGDALERYTYSPYGKVTIHDAAWSNTRDTSSYDNQILYTGRRLDGETGLYFYRARYYSAELGRFIGRDPIGYFGGISLYTYCGDRPTIGVDPLGLKIGISNGISTADDLVSVANKVRFMDDVLKALQSTVGDCAKLKLTDEVYMYTGPGSSPLLQSASIGYSQVKTPCKNCACWQEIKKAIDSKDGLNVNYIRGKNRGFWDEGGPWPWSPDAGVYINPGIDVTLWEIDPNGGWIANQTPFAVALYHELIGHGFHGVSGHPDKWKNNIESGSNYYDPVIRDENVARKCLTLNERVYQYWGQPDTVKPGDRRQPPKPDQIKQPPQMSGRY